MSDKMTAQCHCGEVVFTVAVNVACLEGVSPFDFSPVRVNDGINHQNDGGVAGWLSYQPE